MVWWKGNVLGCRPSGNRQTVVCCNPITARTSDLIVPLTIEHAGQIQQQACKDFVEHQPATRILICPLQPQSGFYYTGTPERIDHTKPCMGWWFLGNVDRDMRSSQEYDDAVHPSLTGNLHAALTKQTEEEASMPCHCIGEYHHQLVIGLNIRYKFGIVGMLKRGFCT